MDDVPMGSGLPAPAMAAGAGGDIVEHDWTFDGPFGFFDKASLQRGFQVYREGLHY